MRKGEGIAGIGEALRLEFHGDRRITDAARAWRNLTSHAEIDDQVGLPGTGLVGFGAFTFSATSRLPSVLIVPSVVVGRRDGQTWLTRLSVVASQDASTPAARQACSTIERAGGALRHVTPRRSGARHGGLFGWVKDTERSAGHRLADFTGPQGGGRLPRPEPPGAEYRITFTPGAMDADAYRDAVAAGVARIRKGDLAKVVLARDLTGHLPLGADVRLALRKLATSYPQCWTYAVDGIVGSSPETLITVDRGAFTARVLAGTTSRGGDALADHARSHELETNSKDHREHELAVRSVVDTLRAHSTDLARTPEPFTLKLPNLWHLATDIRGTLADGSTSLDLVSALHPTAAVAGTPAAAATEVIESLEPFDRGRYAGPVGWVDAHGDGEWAIALRGAQIGADRNITAYAGCGIVAGSDPDSELEESAMKLRPIIETFG
jgi:menaquinone-specific isochorismate synthase